MSFEPINNFEQEEAVVTEHHIGVFSIVKFVLAVVVAVSIVVYTLIWIKQMSGSSNQNTTTDPEYTENINDEPLTAEERQVILDAMNTDEPVPDGEGGGATPAAESAFESEVEAKRAAILEAMNTDESGSESGAETEDLSASDRQSILDAMNTD